MPLFAIVTAGCATSRAEQGGNRVFLRHGEALVRQPYALPPGAPAVARASASATARSTASSSSRPGLPSANCWLVAYTPLAITVAPRLANSGRIPWSTESEWAAPCPVTIGTPTLPIRQSCGSRSKKSLSRPLYVARYTGVPATTIRARVATSSAAMTVGLVPRPSSGSAGSAARSTSWVVAPRAASRASAYSTSMRDLDVVDGLPEIPTATRSLVESLTPPRSHPAPDLLGLVQETLQRERLDEEMLRLEEQPHALFAGACFRADQHEPAAELRPDRQRVLPQPQPPALRHVQIRDDGVRTARPGRPLVLHARSLRS